MIWWGHSCISPILLLVVLISALHVWLAAGSISSSCLYSINNGHRIFMGGRLAPLRHHSVTPRFGYSKRPAHLPPLSAPGPPVPVSVSVQQLNDVTKQYSILSRTQILQSLYGRLSPSIVDQVKSISLPELFQWTLEHSYLNQRRAHLAADPIADLLMDLFNISLSLSPVGFERFIGVFERLQRLVRAEYAAGAFMLLDPTGHVDWRNCSLSDWYPPQHAFVYNISEAMLSRRFDLTKPLEGEVTYSDDELRRWWSRGSVSDFSRQRGLNVSLTRDLYLPSNPCNPGFDSVTFVRDINSQQRVQRPKDDGGGLTENALPTAPTVAPPPPAELVAVLSEQKLSTSRSRLYINLYKDVVRKKALAMETVSRRWATATQPQLIQLPGRMNSNNKSRSSRSPWSPWNENNTVLVGHYLRQLNPRLHEDSNINNSKESYVGVASASSLSSSSSSSILTTYLRRFEVPANTVMLDERGLRYHLGPALFELLQVGRNKSRLDRRHGTVNTQYNNDYLDTVVDSKQQSNNRKTRQHMRQQQNTNKEMAQYLTRALQFKYALANQPTATI